MMEISKILTLKLQQSMLLLNHSAQKEKIIVVSTTFLKLLSLSYTPRLMKMSPLYPYGKPCSRRTHNETVKNPGLSPAFDRSNHDRTTAVAHAMKTELSRHLISETWYESDERSSVYLVSAKFVFQRYIFLVFKTKTNQRNL